MQVGGASSGALQVGSSPAGRCSASLRDDARPDTAVTVRLCRVPKCSLDPTLRATTYFFPSIPGIR